MMQAWRIVREVGAGEMVDAVDDAVERAAETLEAVDDEMVFKSVSSLPSPAPVDVPASDSEGAGAVEAGGCHGPRRGARDVLMAFRGRRGRSARGGGLAGCALTAALGRASRTAALGALPSIGRRPVE